jgi:hypothetical protein
MIGEPGRKETWDCEATEFTFSCGNAVFGAFTVKSLLQKEILLVDIDAGRPAVYAKS